MEKKVLVFSFESTDEHIGLVEMETDDIFVCSHVLTMFKQPDQKGQMSVNTIPFSFNATGIEKVTIVKKHLKWYSEDMDKDIKKNFLTSVSGLVVANTADLQNLNKNNVVPFKK